MKDIIYGLISDALDESALIDALVEEVRNRLDYAEIAESILDAYEAEFQEAVADVAVEKLT